MTVTYDPTTPIGFTRLLIPDRVIANAVYTDEEISAFLLAELATPKRAAALALETLAADRAMVLQVIRTNGLSTDGAKLSDALLKRAGLLRTQATTEEGYLPGGTFDYAEEVNGNFSYKERMWDEIMRSEGAGTTP
jgi:hypothetical protein